MSTKTVLKYKTKGSLKSIIENNFDGVFREFLANDSNKIFSMANKINKHFEGNIYLEVKYPYGFREKRIEILLKDKTKYYLIKILRDKTKIDKEALLLDELIIEIQKNMHLMTKGIIILCEKIDKNVIDDINNNLRNNIVFITEQFIENLHKKIKLEELKDGIFS